MQWAKVIPAYFRADSSMKDFKKRRDELNTELKQAMEKGNLTEKEAGGYVAKRSIQERTSMNNEILLDILKKRKLTKAIKVVELPDEQVVEDLIASGELTTEDIAPAVSVKEVVTLKVIPVKKGKK